MIIDDNCEFCEDLNFDGEVSVGCGQTNVPTVDNSNSGCTKLFDSKCIIFEDSIPYIGASSQSNLEVLLKLLVKKIKIQDLKIKSLEKVINTLNNQ